MESTNDIEKALLHCELPMLPTCCIFRVPEVLRRQNKEAYEPNIVSIGPIYRGRPQFELVEKVKKRYFTSLLSHLKISLQDLIKRVLNELEQPARECYADTFDLDQNKFAEMLILDGCYLIQLFLKGPVEEQEDEQEEEPTNFNASFMLEYLYHDLLLLENQLPWPVLMFFYDLIEWDNAEKALSEVVIDFFKPVMAGDRDATILSNPKPDVEIHHILDLIRTALIEEEHQDQSPLSRTIISRLPQRIPSAVTLLEAGVKFKPAPQGCILNINFKDGVFTIPVLTIDQKTGPLFMNLLVYEQCFHRCNYRITSYVILMRNIINTSKDVDLLCEKGIVANWLWSAEDACKLVNEVSINTTITDYHYWILSNDVNEYQKSLWGQWMRVINFICIYRLTRDYFNTPWATISVFAAFVLLVLTFLQTIYTMLPSDRHPSPAPG